MKYWILLGFVLAGCGSERELVEAIPSPSPSPDIFEQQEVAEPSPTPSPTHCGGGGA